MLPELHWRPTAARSSRHGHPVTIVVVHRWGVRYVSPAQEAKSYEGVVGYLQDASNKASAHVVFPGSAVPGEAAQLVAWGDLAWAQAAYNAAADDVESADACWLPSPSDHGRVIDEAGLAVLARIVASRLHARRLPPVWSTRHGFCRHADLGAAGGGHTSCPTTNLALWRRFVSLVEHEADRGGFRPVWGR